MRSMVEGARGAEVSREAVAPSAALARGGPLSRFAGQDGSSPLGVAVRDWCKRLSTKGHHSVPEGRQLFTPASPQSRGPS
jgi:hypothetical protein